MAVDMHFHTNCSDSFTDVNRLMELAQARRAGVAITDHNLIDSIRKIQGNEYTVPVIPGMEVSTSDGPHILVYFYEYKDLEGFWSREIRPRLNHCPWLALKECPTESLLDLLEKGRDGVRALAVHYMKLFGSAGRLKGCSVAANTLPEHMLRGE